MIHFFLLFVNMLICHISDIHLRNGNKLLSRFHEYSQVFHSFNNILLKFKAKFPHKTCVSVIAGDFFHHKYKIENFSALLANFIINLRNYI